MKNLIQLILILLTMSIISCQKQDGYVITGNLTGFPDSTMIYLKNINTEEVIDSAQIINNNFEFKGQLQSVPKQLWLTATVNNKFVYTNLLIGNEIVTVKGNIKDFPRNLDISGSRIQDDYNYLQNLTKSLTTTRDSIIQNYFKLSKEEQLEQKKELGSRLKIIDSTTLSLRLEYIKSHINTYPALIYLGYFQNSLPKDTVQSLYNKLSPELKASEYARIVKVHLDEKISKIGDQYHDFEAFDKDGNIIKLSELKGKYILLDFTASYCLPCKQAIKELKLINKTYNDSLTIVSFSADTKKDVWLTSLKRDDISWISLWDGKGGYSETVIKYGVSGFPTFFLIDPKGKIIDMWSGYGKGSLEDRLNRFNTN